jgi:hypothetical protein
LDRIAGGAQPARRDSARYDLTNIRFNDGRLPAVDQVDFSRKRVDTNDLMSTVRETPRRNGADIAQSKNADSQDVCLSVWSSELEIAICYKFRTPEVKAKRRLQFSPPLRGDRSYSCAISDAFGQTREGFKFRGLLEFGQPVCALSCVDLLATGGTLSSWMVAPFPINEALVVAQTNF